MTPFVTPHVVFNGQVLTKDDLERLQTNIEVISQPSDQRVLSDKRSQQLPEDESSSASSSPTPSHTLKLLGYWSYPAHYGISPDPEEPVWPDIRRAVQPGWRMEEREKILAYLRQGHLYCAYFGYSSCRFQCRGTYSILGTAELTDGEWVWPDGLVHYIERHGVILPEEFVAGASARNWTVPPLEEVLAKMPSMRFFHLETQEEEREFMEKFYSDDLPQEPDVRVDSSSWVAWARGLPEIARTEPDPYALQRFRIVLQGPDTDIPDDPMIAFDTEVWDQLVQLYGRQTPNVGDEMCMESLLKDRDAIVSTLLDGLRRYQLLERCRLICSEPDPTDWQRDRDQVI